MRYLMTFSYDGTLFYGYQKQPKKRTVQEEIEKRLKKINGNKKVIIHASGRTDRAVHALNQKVHLDLDVDITPLKLKKALNSSLNDDIYIKEVIEVDKKFHARYNAKAKEYIYIINMGEYNPIERNYVLQHNKNLDLAEMERALKYLEGEHDFKAFTKANNKKESYVRKITNANLIRDSKNTKRVTLSFVGTGFLKYQIRNIVGTLLQIGDGKMKSDQIITIIEERDRRKAGVTAPGCGLYLKNVFY